MNKPIQIFKTGKHTDSSGVALAFSESDLTASASAYDPAIHEAPIVVGHPKNDLPAYGWIKHLSFSDSGLEAEPHQVNVDFAEMVKTGAFKKISASFYTPDSAANPVPGVYYLRHVGFLGAEPPAVKGLRAPEFNDASEGIVTFSELEFSGYSEIGIAKLFRRIREWFIASSGTDLADKVLPDWEIASLERDAMTELIEDAQTKNPDLTLSNFNEHKLGDEMSAEEKTRLAALADENAVLKKQNADFKKQQADFAEAQLKTRCDAAHAENIAFAEGLVKSGQLLPAHKDAVVATLDFVSAPATVVEFGEGDAKQPLAVALKATLTAATKLVEFGEHSGGSEVKQALFNAPAGFQVDQTNLEIHQKALAFSEANSVSYEVALSKVQ